MILFLFVIKDSTSREKKYQQTISNLTEHLGVVKMIKEDVDDIKSMVYKTDKKNSKKATSISNSTDVKE